MGNSKTENNEEIKQVKRTDGAEQIKLTMYTIVSMLVTLISAGVTIVAMVIYAKPVIYVIEVTVGKTFNTYSHEALEQLMYENDPDLAIYGLYLAVALLVVASAVVTLIGMIKATNEYNKPNVILTIVGLVCAAAALVVYFYADDYTKDAIRAYGFPEVPMFNIYSVYMPLLITNVAAMACNILATASGLSRWKKTGKTSK